MACVLFPAYLARFIACLSCRLRAFKRFGAVSAVVEFAARLMVFHGLYVGAVSLLPMPGVLMLKRQGFIRAIFGGG